MKRFIIVGLGNFGAGVAEALYRAGHDVIALDTSESAVDRIAQFVGRAAVGDGREARTLERIGAGDADAAIISTGDDITASVLTTLALRDLGIREIYVKVISRDHGRVMDRLGVTETVFPERESALRLGHRIAHQTLLQYVQLGENFSVQEMAVPDAWVGHSLRELELPRQYRVSVIAVHDVLTDEIMPVPDPDAPLKESDTLLVAGRNEHLDRVARPRQ
ncbi:MAG TPA: TrkA family potassium uptake protein [Longimicrobiales bacterium]|nr:TrkA family potassium uptake protein [Longimicrobiales bacterium]